MKVTYILSLVVLGALAPCLHASIFSWDITPAIGDSLTLHLTNWEPDATTVLTDGVLFGVGTIDQIIDNTQLGSPVVWSKGANKELTIAFSDFVVAATSGTNIFFTGGKVDVYFDDTPDVAAYTNNSASPGLGFAPPLGTNSDPDATAGNTFTDGSGGTLVMELVGHAGVDAAGLYSLISSFDPSTDSGSGSGFLDVVPNSGPLASEFDLNNILAKNGTFADFKLKTGLDPSNDPTSGASPIISSDPITTFYAGVPEPNSAFVWISLIGAIGGVVVLSQRWQVARRSS